MKSDAQRRGSITRGRSLRRPQEANPLDPLRIRELREADWPSVFDLANRSVAHIPGAGSQDEWVRNRRSFDALRGVQQQLVAEISDSPVGYGALESRDPLRPRSFRLFVVTAPRLLDAVGQHLYDELRARLGKLGATEAWFREYASDASFIEFARGNGFFERRREVLGGSEVIILGQVLSSEDAAA